MKGKKVDKDFLNSFINECLKNGITSSQEMAELAKEQISNIDEKIKEIESLKILRCKLLDVVSTFEKTEKQISLHEKNILLWHNIGNINVSKKICKLMTDHNYDLSLKIVEDSIDESKYEIYYCIKQMILTSVLKNGNKSLIKGQSFDEYVEFIRER